MDFDFRCRMAAPTARRSSAALNFAGLPAPTANTRFARMPGTLCSSVVSNGLPAISPASYNSPRPRRSSRRSWKTRNTKASVCTCSIGWRWRVICIGFVFIVLSVLLPCLTGAHRRSGFGLGRFGALGLALVVQFLAAGQGHFALNAPLLQIDLGGDQRQALFARLAQQFVDLLPVQQQLPIAHRRMVLAIAIGVLTDVRIHQPSLVLLDRRVGLFELHFARAGGLHFGARQHQAGFKALHQKVVVARGTVIAQDLEFGFFCGHICSQRGELPQRHPVVAAWSTRLPIILPYALQRAWNSQK